MSDEHKTTPSSVRRALTAISNDALLDLRAALWAAGNAEAALAVDDARNGIALVCHDLRRAETRMEEAARG